jgi:hypothetical protein
MVSDESGVCVSGDSGDHIVSIIMAVPLIWLGLVIWTLVARSNDPADRGLRARLGVLLGMGVGTLLGGCLGLALGMYLTRDQDYPLPGLVAIPGALIGALIGAVGGGWMALRHE